MYFGERLVETMIRIGHMSFLSGELEGGRDLVESLPAHAQGQALAQLISVLAEGRWVPK